MTMSIIPVTAFPRSFLSTFFMTGETSLIAFQRDPRFSYRAYIPDAHYPQEATSSTKLPLVVVVHGTSRSFERCIAAWKDFADANGCAIVAPLFPASIQGPLDLDGYHYLGKPPPSESDRFQQLQKHAIPVESLVPHDTEVRYDLLLLSILDEVAIRWPAIDISKFYLSGFSGGAQFSHRFLYLHPERLLGVNIGAPGTTTHLAFDRSWPFGVKNTEDIFGQTVNLDLVTKVPILVVVGSDDIQVSATKARLALKGKGFGSEDEVAKTRVEKASLLLNNLRDVGVVDVELEIVDGAAHDMIKCNPAAVRFLTKLFEKKTRD